MNPFDYIKQINTGKVDFIATGQAEDEGYVPFITNRALSDFPDTLFIANEANYRLKDAPKHAQFQFYFHLVDKRPRYSKWRKHEKNDKIQFLAEAFHIGYMEAEEIQDLIPDDKFNELYLSYQNFGGRG